MAGKRILIIDDDFATRELIESILDEPEIYEIIKAEDAKDGFEKLELRPDLILVDIMMPQLDGYEFIRRVRNIGPDRNVKMIVLTAKHQEQDMLEAIKAGANEFITKPFEVDFIKKRIDMNLFTPEQLPEEDQRTKYNGSLHYIKGRKSK